MCLIQHAGLFVFVSFKAKLKIQISSYTSLLTGTGTIQLSIDGLSVLIAPKPSLDYDAEKERSENQEKKLNKVKKLLEQEIKGDKRSRNFTYLYTSK